MCPKAKLPKIKQLRKHFPPSPAAAASPEAVSSIVYFGPACLRPAFLAGSFYPAHFDPAKKAGLNQYNQVKKW